MEAQRSILRLRVVPGARRAGVVGLHGDAWKIRVTARAEAGKANDAALALLAATLGVPRHDLELTSGRSSRDKVVALRRLAPDTAAERLAGAVQSA